MPSATSRARARERLEQLASAGLDDERLRLEALGALRCSIGFAAWSWATADPGSHLAVSALAEHPLGRSMPALLMAEEDETDPTRRTTLAASAYPVSLLSSVTRGDLARHPRWRDHLARHGIGDELRAVFADASGCWGYLDLYRDDTQKRFSEDDAHFLRQLVPVLTAGLRRAQAPQVVRARPHASRHPAVLILDEQLRLVAQTGPAPQWLRVLRGAPGELLPCAVMAAGARALAAPHADAAWVRQRDRDGDWATVRAARLDTGGLAVTIDYATPAEVLGFGVRAWGLSAREREVVYQLYAGFDTRAIAHQLVISERTVHDHVKHIFAKTGHASCRDLLASLRPPTTSIL